MQYVVENKTKNGMNFTLCFQRHIYIVYVFIWGQVHLSVMSKERGAFNPKDTARVKKIKLDRSNHTLLNINSMLLFPPSVR